jgi:uncharacterized protein
MITSEEIAQKIRPTLEKYEVSYAGLFGSHARGDARPDSDVDILVSLGDKPLSVWDMIAFKRELSDILKRTVDLLSDKAIIPYFKDYIYRDLKTLYE